MWETIDCVYIIGHPKHEKERIQYVVSHLQKHGCPKDTVRISCPTWSDTINDSDCFKVYDPFLPRAFPCINFKCRWLLKGEISLVLNFHNAVLDAVQNGFQRIMVLESDVRLRHDFAERFRTLMQKADTDKSWSYISLSDGVGTHSEGCMTGCWYAPQELKEPNNQSKYAPFRCTDSMIFNRPFLDFLVKNLIPFRDCLDWELNCQIHAFNGKAMWAEPHLIEQATQKRMAASSLRY